MMNRELDGSKECLIVSDPYDISTVKVMAWIHAFGYKSIRVRSDKFNYTYQLVKFKKLLNRVTGVWLRRGDFPPINIGHKSLYYEYQTLKKYLHYLSERHSNSIGSIQKELEHNKMIDLYKAESVGLNIPETHVVTSSAEIREILSKNPAKRFITKALCDQITFESEEFAYSGGRTAFVKEADLSDEGELFPSLIQMYVPKIYEIRSFYLKGSFYSMAIFSQNDPSTSLDYRNYNDLRPNRKVPYKLTDEVQKKLKELMSLIGLNSGSIDLIYSNSQEYYFLEVNPIGHFDWLSESCNYNVEKDIARRLIMQDERRS